MQTPFGRDNRIKKRYYPKRNSLSFKERAGGEDGLVWRHQETHPHLDPPLEGEEKKLILSNC
jgi:hypothetical protein